jgi:hypothetical protein
MSQTALERRDFPVPMRWPHAGSDGNPTRFGASQRSATRRCASQHIATQRLSRWGSPAARARLARTLPSIACGSETPNAANRS